LLQCSYLLTSIVFIVIEVGSEHGDQQLDVETVDHSVDLATVKQEVFDDDADNATMERALSPCTSDSMEQKFSYELLDTSANQKSDKYVSARRGRGSEVTPGARRSSSRRGRPVCFSFYYHYLLYPELHRCSHSSYLRTNLTIKIAISYVIIL